MSLDLSKLESVRHVNGKTLARCPACARNGGDKEGAHLFIHDNGKFGCIKFSGPEGAAHRKEIFALAGDVKSKNEPTAVYHYCNEAGDVLYEKVRYGNGESKSFAFRRPDPARPGVFIYKMEDTRRVLYRLHDVRKAIMECRTVFVVEGEKDSDTLHELGLCGTSSDQGAPHGLRKEEAAALAGADVAVFIDEDKAGHEQAAKVLLMLHGRVKRLRFVRLPGLAYVDKHGQDVTDWLNNGHTKDELLKLVEAAPDFELKQLDALIGVKSAEPVEAEVDPKFLPFPVDALPGPIRNFVTAASAAMGCDPSYVALPALTVLAAGIGNSHRVEIKPGWTEPAVMFSAIVGDSGSMKSPPMSAALEPVREIENEFMRENRKREAAHEGEQLRYDCALALWKRGRGKGAPPTKPPEYLAKRVVVSDTTVEALCTCLSQNPRGLLLARDELDGWFGSFDRYAQTKGADAAHWLSMFRAEQIIVDRKSNKAPLHVPRAFVCILGSIQPPILRRALTEENREKGLPARFLFAWPPCQPRHWTEKQIEFHVVYEYGRVLRGLYGMAMTTNEYGEPEPAIVKLSADAKAAFVDFYNRNGVELSERAGDLAAAWSKLEAYAARFSLVIQFARHAAGETSVCTEVEGPSMTSAIMLTEWFKHEATRIYRLLDETPADRERRQLLDLINRKGGKITARELQQSSRIYKTAEKAETALTSLVHAGLGRWEDVSPTNRGGRPSRCFTLHAPSTVYETHENPSETECSVDTDTAAQPPASAVPDPVQEEVRI